MKSIRNFTCIVACLAIMGCHKDNNNGNTSADKQLTAADAGKTASVTTGQAISLTLSNPGDGGYHFDDAKFNSSVLTLVNHTQHAGDPKRIGDFGTDTWTFTAKGTGTTTLEVTASRASAETVTMFESQVTVK